MKNKISSLLTVFFAVITPASAKTQYEIVRVAPGTTLFSLSQKHSVSIESIRLLNSLDGNLIIVGQNLKIPKSPLSASPPSRAHVHTVNAGQTLSSIARAHNTSLNHLKKINPSLDPDLLQIGDKIKLYETGVPPQKKPTIVHASRYKQLKNNLAAKQNLLKKQYLQASTNKDKKEVIHQARTLLENEMPKLMHCWIGTGWDMNGTSKIPHEGKIACGYFVGAILIDSGFKVKRTDIGQAASQKIIETMLKKNDLIINPAKTSSKFLEHVKPLDGIYIIGLDKHVGYLVCRNGVVSYIHSGKTNGVVNQDAKSAYSIVKSKFRVTGNITTYDYVIEKWLQNKHLVTKK